MVPDHEDLSRKGVRAAGHEDLFNRADGRRSRGTGSGAARSITHQQDSRCPQVQPNDQRVPVRVGVVRAVGVKDPHRRVWPMGIGSSLLMRVAWERVIVTAGAG